MHVPSYKLVVGSNNIATIAFTQLQVLGKTTKVSWQVIKPETKSETKQNEIEKGCQNYVEDRQIVC